METLVNTEPLFANYRPNRRIVLCGSMSFYNVMLQFQMKLRANGAACIVPEPEDEIKPLLSPSQFEDFKRKVSFSYLKKIRDPRTFGIFVINLDKYGVKNYIGANTFAEIAVAFVQTKKIYLLQNYPSMYEEELAAWGVVPLNGCVNRVISDYEESCMEISKQQILFQYW
jgi:hypothetical protein